MLIAINGYLIQVYTIIIVCFTERNFNFYNVRMLVMVWQCVQVQYSSFYWINVPNKGFMFKKLFLFVLICI